MRMGTRWRWGALAAVIVAASLMVLSSAGLAAAVDYTNADCQRCHDPSSTDPQKPEVSNKLLDFTAFQLVLQSGQTTAGVDYGACRNCHRPEFVSGSASNHPYHNAGMWCGGCHNGWGSALWTAIARTAASDPRFNGATFNTADPLSENDATAIHTIHTLVRWPNGVTSSNSKCASCHAIAACDACHRQAGMNIDSTHSSHASSKVPATGIVWTRGYDDEPFDQRVLVTESITTTEGACLAAGCHDLAGVTTGASAPVIKESTVHESYFATSTGVQYAYNKSSAYMQVGGGSTWPAASGTGYTGGTARRSNRPGSWVKWAFNGKRVQLIGVKDQYRGKIDVEIDGVPQGTFSLYSYTTRYQAVIFDSILTTPGLSSGDHTITVTVRSDTDGRDTFVDMDQMRMYVDGTASIVPKCLGCHPHREDTHGTSELHPPLTAYDHQAYEASTQAEFGYPCKTCHSMKLYNYSNNEPLGEKSDHEITSTVKDVSVTGCSMCHPRITRQIPPGDREGYTGGCSLVATGTTEAGCHVEPGSATYVYGQVRHSDRVPKHSWTETRFPGDEDSKCFDCHATSYPVARLDFVHSLAPGGCLTCHGFQRVPYMYTSCANDDCHDRDIQTDHAYDTTLHAGQISTQTITTTSGPEVKYCTDCHNADLYTNHWQTLAEYSEGVTCNECHENTSLGARTVIRNNWPTRKCDECHTVRHSEAATDHDFVLRGGDCITCHQLGGSAFTKFDFSNVAAIHAGRSSTETDLPSRTSCNLCHISHSEGVTGTKGHRTIAWNSLSTVSDCNSCHLFSDIPAHATVFDHMTNNSAYNNSEPVTGCTGSGDGCHGSSLDLKAIHKVPGCSSKTGVYNCHDNDGAGPGANEFSSVQRASQGNTRNDGINQRCYDCHDGYYADTPDRVEPNDPWPTGHYGETTHTAAGMDATIGAGGTVSATCNSCHKSDGTIKGLRAQHLGVPMVSSETTHSLTCYDCHNYNAAVTAIVTGTASWSGSCAACHTMSVLGNADLVQHGQAPSGVMGYSGSNAGCGTSDGNCHSTWDLHALHKGDPDVGDTEPSCAGGTGVRACHPSDVQAGKPQTRDCDVCHAGYESNSHYDPTKHQTTSAQVTSTSYAGIQCGACHVTTGSVFDLQQSHTTTYAVLTKYTDATKPSFQTCLDCHNNPGSTSAITSDWPAKTGASACAACHGVAGIPAAHTNASTMHTVTTGTGGQATGCASTGPGCHQGNDLYQVGTKTVPNNNIHASCLQCHDKSGAAAWSAAMIGTSQNLQYNPNEKRCGRSAGCHTSDKYDPSSAWHRIGRSDVVNGNDAKHTATSMDATIGAGIPPQTGTSNQCQSCHSATLANAHKTVMTGWTNTCDACHNNTAGTPDVAPLQVKASWTNDLCSDCHAFGTASDPSKVETGHAKFISGSNHTGTPYGTHANDNDPNTCSGPACHTWAGGSLRFDAIHQRRPSGCLASGCHAVDKPMAGQVVKTCGGDPSDDTNDGNCHFGKTDDNHGATTVHVFSALSDYTSQTATYSVTPSRPEGCTNSGVGCHNTETNYTNFAAYHPTKPGTTCGVNDACHSSPSWTNAPAKWECYDCHDGNYTNAPDRIALIAAYPNGHYNDTTHTADGTYMQSQFDPVGGWLQGNRCANCHDDSLRAVHTDTTNYDDVVCAECHNEYPLVVQNWQAMTAECSDCHSAIHDTYGQGTHTATDGTNNCADSGAGCHVGSDLRVLHKEPTGTATQYGCGVSDVANGGAACHSTLDVRPSAKSCGQGQACHKNYSDTDHNGRTGLDATAHTSDNGTLSLTYNTVTRQCQNCHSMTMSAAHTITPAATCTGCHNDTSPNSVHVIKNTNWQATKDCDDCHVINANGYPTRHNTYATGHTGTTTRGCNNTSAGCHAGVTDLRSLHETSTGSSATTSGCNITGCHTALNEDMASKSKSCDVCHASIQDVSTSASHYRSTEHTAGPSEYANSQFGILCQSCHYMELGYYLSATTSSTEHGAPYSKTSTGGNITCIWCHTQGATVVKNRWTTRTCDACHAVSGGVPAISAVSSRHADASPTAHSTTPNTGCASTGIGCHNGSDLSQVGSVTTINSNIHSTCLRCHDRTATQTAWSAAMIGSGLNLRYNPTVKTCGQAAGCHLSSSYSTATSQHRIGRADVVTGSDAKHTADATSMNATVGVGPAGATNNQCSNCHSSDLANAHKDSSTTANIDYGARTAWSATSQSSCFDCHNETRGSNISALTVKNSWNNGQKYCTNCHSSSTTTTTAIPSMHARFATSTVEAASHEASPVGGVASTCGTSGCHETRKMAQLHILRGRTSCGIAGCHDSKDKGMHVPTMKTCGPGGACHTDARYGTSHGGDHNADYPAGTSWTGASGSPGQYEMGMNYGCFGCHYTDLRREHGDQVLESVSGTSGAARTMQLAAGGTYAANSTTDDRCNACHDDKLNSSSQLMPLGKFNESANATVNAIVDKLTNQANIRDWGEYGKRCDGCHYGNGTNGPRAAHTGGTVPNTPAYVNNYATEFVNYVDNTSPFVGYYGGGGHYALPQQAGGTFVKRYITSGRQVVLRTTSGTAYTVTVGTNWNGLGFDGTWVSGKTTYMGDPLSLTARVTCADCHEWSAGTYPNGPQGAAGVITEKIPAGGVAWKQANGSHLSNMGLIVCGQCHGTPTGHNNHTNSGHYCIHCHLAIPHAWKRPRLLRRTVAITGYPADSAAYSPQPVPGANTNGLSGFGYTGSKWFAQASAVGADNASNWANGGCQTATTACGHTGNSVQYLWP